MIGHLVVELVTPAMIGGAIARECDNPPTLRPPSLRGHLRFWARALGGNDLAQELWGEEQLGQRVRVLSTTTMASRGRRADLKKPVQATLLAAAGERRTTKADMIPPGDQVILRFAIPDGVPLGKLQAVLWTWLHLGTVGRRSRRGYGSLQWRPSEGDLLTGWPPLWPTHHLRSPKTLADYLEAGLTKVASIFPKLNRDPRTNVVDELVTLDQVFVGKALPGTWEASARPTPNREKSLEQLVHGLNADYRGPEPDRAQLGSAKPRRQPSPMMWRLFPVAAGKAYVPVMTWFPTGYDPQSPVRIGADLFKYLNGALGFEKSLTGNDLAAQASQPAAVQT